MISDPQRGLLGANGIHCQPMTQPLDPMANAES
jgi:hypothetical protein